MRRDGLRAFCAIGAKFFGKARLAKLSLASWIGDHFFHVVKVNVTVIALEAVRMVASVVESALVGRDLSLAKGTLKRRAICGVKLLLIDRSLVEGMIVLVGLVGDSLQGPSWIRSAHAHEAVLMSHALVGKLSLLRIVQRIHAALSGQRGRYVGQLGGMVVVRILVLRLYGRGRLWIGHLLMQHLLIRRRHRRNMGHGRCRRCWRHLLHCLLDRPGRLVHALKILVQMSVQHQLAHVVLHGRVLLWRRRRLHAGRQNQTIRFVLHQRLTIAGNRWQSDAAGVVGQHIVLRLTISIAKQALLGLSEGFVPQRLATVGASQTVSMIVVAHDGAGHAAWTYGPIAFGTKQRHVSVSLESRSCCENVVPQTAKWPFGW